MNKQQTEYSSSPAPFVSFILIALLFLVLVLLNYPDPIAILYALLAAVSLFPLPATVAINKEWEEAIILRFGKFQRLVGPGFFFKWPYIEMFMKQDKRIINLDISR